MHRAVYFGPFSDRLDLASLFVIDRTEGNRNMCLFVDSECDDSRVLEKLECPRDDGVPFGPKVK